MQRTANALFRQLILIAMFAGACSTDGDTPSESDPSAPSSLVAAPMGGGVHLTWSDNSSNEEAFEIERKLSGGAFELINSVPFDTDLYHDSDVSLGARYTYRLRAKLAVGFSSYSNEASVNLADEGGGGANSTAGNGAGVGATGGQAGNADADAGGTAGSAGSAAGTGGTGGQAGNADSGGIDDPDANIDTVVSFRDDVVPTLVQTCGSTTAGCHNNDQAVGRIMPQFGPCKVIWFSAVDEPIGATYISGPNQGEPTGCTDLGLYDRLMQQHSMLCDAASWDQRAKYVVPYDLDNSLLYQVIAGDPSMGGVCNNMGEPIGRMPKIDPEVLPVGVELTADRIIKIRDWIMQGAPNN